MLSLADCSVTVDNRTIAISEESSKNLFGLLSSGEGSVPQPAAEVVFVVDESSSLALSHQWLPELATGLEEALHRRGIGQHLPNLYSIVGFASTANGLTGKGHVIRSDGAIFYPVSKFLNASAMLHNDGRREDGYCAIQHALDRVRSSHRANSCLHLILITDEDRDLECAELDIIIIKAHVKQDKAGLVAVLKQRYIDPTDQQVFGIDYNSVGFLYEQMTNRGYRR